MKYAELNATNPAYDGEYLADLHALYKGGQEFLKRITRFLPKNQVEDLERYQLRLREAEYENYVGPSVDYLAALLFQQKPTIRAHDETKSTTDRKEVDVDPWYQDWREDCDGLGCDLDRLIHDAFVDALQFKCGWIAVELPRPAEAEPRDLAEHKALGQGEARLRRVDARDVIDWDYNADGSLAWAIEHSKESPRLDPTQGGRDQIVERWRIFTATRVDVYEITYKVDRPPAGDTEVPRVDTTTHALGRVPLVPLDIGAGLWLANRLESPQKSHIRLLNAQNWAFKSSCYQMPVFKCRDDDARKNLPALGSGYGVTLAIDETFEWVGPSNISFDALGTAIASRKDEIYRIATQMALGVDNNAAAIGRSGESKEADTEATRVLLLAYAEPVSELYEVLYDLAAVVRGDKYEFSIEGFKRFQILGLGKLLEAASKISLAGGIPSRTFNFELKSRIAQAAISDADQATKDLVRKEIDDATSAEEQFQSLAEKALDKATRNQPKQMPPGFPPPGKPPPGKGNGKGPPAKA